jgi:hypothetical protein
MRHGHSQNRCSPWEVAGESVERQSTVASRDVVALNPEVRLSVCFKAADLPTVQVCATGYGNGAFFSAAGQLSTTRMVCEAVYQLAERRRESAGRRL